jgi:hypothetical protein
LKKLQAFSIPLNEIPVKPEVVGRWKPIAGGTIFRSSEDLKAYGCGNSCPNVAKTKV